MCYVGKTYGLETHTGSRQALLLLTSHTSHIDVTMAMLTKQQNSIRNNIDCRHTHSRLRSKYINAALV